MKFKTFKEVEKAAIDWINEEIPDDGSGNTYWIAALEHFGFKQDGYDMYGARVWSKDNIRIAVYYDRGDCCWVIEQAQGRSNTTDNFYNTESERHDENGIYGRGNDYDPWN